MIETQVVIHLGRDPLPKAWSNGPIGPQSLVFFNTNIDDAGVAFRIIFGGRISDDFKGINFIGLDRF